MLFKGDKKLSVFNAEVGKKVARFSELGLFETQDKPVQDYLKKQGYLVHPVAKTVQEYLDYIEFIPSVEAEKKDEPPKEPEKEPAKDSADDKLKEIQELRVKCDEKGITYHHKAKSAKLKELLGE